MNELGRRLLEGEDYHYDTVNCKKCGGEVSELAVFPGGICLSCHEKKFDAQVLANGGILPRPDFTRVLKTGASLREDSMRLRELPGNLRKQAASLLKSGRAYYDSDKKNIRWSRKGDCCVPINDSPAAINKYLDESTRFVHLQGIGKTPAILARELRPGYIISWNYQPDSYVVKSIEVASPQYLRVSTEHIASGREYTQKLSRDRLVAARKPN